MPIYYSTTPHQQREQQTASFVPSLPSQLFSFEKPAPRADELYRSLHPLPMDPRRPRQGWQEDYLNSQQRRSYSSSPASGSGIYRQPEPTQNPYSNYMSLPISRPVRSNYLQHHLAESIERSPPSAYSAISSRRSSQTLSPPDYSHSPASHTLSPPSLTFSPPGHTLSPPTVYSAYYSRESSQTFGSSREASIEPARDEPEALPPPHRPDWSGKPHRPSSWFLRFPPFFYAMLDEYLEDKHWHRLQCLFSSRRLNAEGTKHLPDPEDVIFLPPRLKYVRMMRNDRLGPKARQKGTEKHLACFHCYRMKDPSQFQDMDKGEIYAYARVKIHRDRTGTRRGPQRYYVPMNTEYARSREPSVATSNNSRRGSAASLSLTSLGGGVMIALPLPKPWTSSWQGAREGEVEKLRRYCIDCAIETCLLKPSDLFLTRTGIKLWICKCTIPRCHDQNKQMVCPICNEHQNKFNNPARVSPDY